MIVVENAITLTQPWATLMAMDRKRNETRAWSTRFRGWIAIHAAKGFPRSCRELCYLQPFARTLAHYNRPDDLPLGQVLAIVEIVDCLPTEGHTKHCMLEHERDFGDYSPDRFFFITRGVRRLEQPIAVKGALGIWKLPRPIVVPD
jgi:activating signal cointegrator 1